MKRYYYLLITLLLPVVVLAEPNAHGWCEAGAQQVTVSGIKSTTLVQASYPSCTITVTVHGTGTVATLYADASLTPLANPFTSSTNGQWLFYADAGRYDIQMSGSTFTTPVTYVDVILIDASGGGGGGGATPALPVGSLQYNAGTNLGGSGFYYATVPGPTVIFGANTVNAISNVNSWGGGSFGQENPVGNPVLWLEEPDQDRGVPINVGYLFAAGPSTDPDGGMTFQIVSTVNLVGSPRATGSFPLAFISNIGGSGTGYCFTDDATGHTCGAAGQFVASDIDTDTVSGQDLAAVVAQLALTKSSGNVNDTAAFVVKAPSNCYWAAPACATAPETANTMYGLRVMDMGGWTTTEQAGIKIESQTDPSTGLKYAIDAASGSGPSLFADGIIFTPATALTGASGKSVIYQDTGTSLLTFKSNSNTALTMAGFTGAITNANPVCASGTTGAITTVGCGGFNAASNIAFSGTNSHSGVETFTNTINAAALNATTTAVTTFSATSITDSGLTAGRCVQTTTGGLFTVAAAACGSSSGTVTVTGTPSNANLTCFSGGTSVTNCNLTGDVSTTNTAVTTLAASIGGSHTFTGAITTTSQLLNSPTLATPVINGKTNGTGIQGNGNFLLSAGTISLTTGSPLCTDATGAATTTGCGGTGFSKISTGILNTVCSTTNASGATCTSTVTWASAFADTNYAASCTGVGPVQYPIILGITSLTASSVTVKISNGSGNMAQVSTFSSLRCVGIHP